MTLILRRQLCAGQSLSGRLLADENLGSMAKVFPTVCKPMHEYEPTKPIVRWSTQEPQVTRIAAQQAAQGQAPLADLGCRASDSQLERWGSQFHAWGVYR